MAMSALVAVQLAEWVVGLTANERFKAVQNLDSGGSVLTSRWFTITMVVVLAGSIVTLLAVGLHKKVGELRTAEKSFSERTARKGLSELEMDTLMAIAVKAGLKKSEDIFNMTGAFESSAAKLLEESRSGGRATTETSQLEKQLIDLRAKLGFRKVSSSAANAPVKPDVKPAGVKPVEISVSGIAYIALYPFSKKLELPAVSQVEPTSSDRKLPQFTPAKVIGVVGRVVYVETTLSANVGDRVLVVIESQSVSEAARVRELIEDIGVVQQSVQPAESIDTPNTRRLAVEIAGLSESQAKQLAGVVGGAKAKQTNGVKEEIK